jgi:hypothetical protein
MELSSLQEHYEALTKEGYQVMGVEVLVRHLNNFLLLRPPRYQGWALPSVLLREQQFYTYEAEINKKAHQLGLIGLAFKGWLAPYTVAIPRKQAWMRLLLTTTSSSLAPPPGYSWFWYCPYPQRSDAQMLGWELEKLFNKVKENYPPINQEVEARHRYDLADPSEEWLEYEPPNNLWLWHEGDGSCEPAK